MRTSLKTLTFTLALAACDPMGGGQVDPNKAKSVQLWNCTHNSPPGTPQTGTSFKIWTRVDGGEWVEHPPDMGVIDNWTTCTLPPNEPKKLDLLNPPGDWEICAMIMPRLDAPPPQCNTTDPDATDACTCLRSFYQGDVTGSENVPIELHVAGD